MAIKKKAPVTGIKSTPKKKARHRAKPRKGPDDEIVIFTPYKTYGDEYKAVTGIKHMIDMPCHGEENDMVRLAVVLVQEPPNTDHPHLSHEALYDYETGVLIGYMRAAPGSMKDAERIQISLQQIAYDKGIDEMLTDMERHTILNY